MAQLCYTVKNYQNNRKILAFPGNDELKNPLLI